MIRLALAAAILLPIVLTLSQSEAMLRRLTEEVPTVAPRSAVATPVPAVAAIAAAPLSGSGELSTDLGSRGIGFGSEGQAKELLAIIQQNPGKANYNISYRTDIDAVVFGADVTRQVIVRVHQEAGKGGSQETWSGYTLERLRNAAAGGSLNDTPAGKLMGTFQRN
ncbi:MAG TPA: hypothetical protein VGL99_00705 [Chloroflexota bacterium]|jgi:hypothetical protein